MLDYVGSVRRHETADEFPLRKEPSRRWLGLRLEIAFVRNIALSIGRGSDLCGKREGRVRSLIPACP